MIPANLERAVFGVYATQALRLADRCGVFEHLAAHGPAAAAELAGAAAVETDTLDRLLLVLTAFGVLDRRAGRYGFADGVRPYLDRDDPQYLMGFVAHLADDTTHQFGRLAEYLSRGKDAVDGTSPAPFDSLYRDEESVRRFLDAMWSLSFHVSHELAVLAELDGCTRLVDVGGAGGPFSVAALHTYPGLTSTVFDLPQVGPHLAATARKYELTDRLHFAGGDFFADPLPPGDCLAFGYILSDWDDAACEKLLRKAHDACRPGGRVLIMERLFEDDRSGPLATAVMNLSMHFETHGRHRTPGEYLDLLRRAGLSRVTVRRSTRDKHLVIGWRD
jgi:hypothetical protein